MISKIVTAISLLVIVVNITDCVYVRISNYDSIQFPLTQFWKFPIKTTQFECKCDYDHGQSVNSIKLLFNDKEIVSIDTTKVDSKPELIKIFDKNLTKVDIKKAIFSKPCKLTVPLIDVSRDSEGKYQCQVNYSPSKEPVKSLMYYETTRWSNNSFYFIEYHSNAVAVKLSMILTIISILLFVFTN
ncbi:uncharacterized protein LOC128960188 [Oppia nitens]|uniref:uncharacterized protein LOC128960188 n=1 Tax=Oppia nitens TaxID=1686743 RepID=UPI0023DA2C69|nr:uncharacterized protein LOC128960188 [Oppia nitens]